tara:strand:- start:561 stop:1175 length:615 start_codon:yes stop_codon:yes gene_type:complete
MSNARNLSKLLGSSTSVPASNMADGSLILLHAVALGVAASEIAFNNTYINVTYDDYLMIGKSVTPATDGAEPLIRVSTDNGSSFGVNCDNGRQYTPLHTNTSQGIEINRYTDGSSIQLATDLGNDANQGANFHAHFFGLNSTSFQKFMFYQTIAKHQSIEYKWDGGANMETTNAINYLEFKFSSGNVAAGARIALYGIKGSNHA